MNENLNLIEILKGCPRGTKLYSTQYGEVEFEKVRENSKYPITIRLNDNQIDMFASDGRWNKSYNGECVLFPSKEQRDWSKFTATWYKKEIDTIARIDSNK